MTCGHWHLTKDTSKRKAPKERNRLAMGVAHCFKQNQNDKTKLKPMNKIIIPIIISLIWIMGCNETDKAQSIIDKSIAAHGSSNLENAILSFDFRDRLYTAKRENGLYEYTRSYEDDSLGLVKDILHNEGFYRMINGERIELTEERANAFANSVNSVIYFAILPYNLNDQAVHKQYVGESTIKGQNYHKIKISFEQEGGGEDHEDIFYYWIDTETYLIDYMAYSFISDYTREIDYRFRESIKQHDVDGLILIDYNNYKAKSLDINFEQMEELFKNDELQLLSKIEMENIKLKKLL